MKILVLIVLSWTCSDAYKLRSKKARSQSTVISKQSAVINQQRSDVIDKVSGAAKRKIFAERSSASSAAPDDYCCGLSQEESYWNADDCAGYGRYCAKFWQHQGDVDCREEEDKGYCASLMPAPAPPPAPAPAACDNGFSCDGEWCWEGINGFKPNTQEKCGEQGDPCLYCSSGGTAGLKCDYEPDRAMASLTGELVSPSDSFQDSDKVCGMFCCGKQQAGYAGEVSAPMDPGRFFTCECNDGVGGEVEIAYYRVDAITGRVGQTADQTAVNEFDVAGQTLEYTGVEVCKVEKDNGFECKKENYDCSVNPAVVNGPSIWTEGAGCPRKKCLYPDEESGECSSNDDMWEKWVDVTNAVRCMHNLPGVGWNQAVANRATAWFGKDEIQFMEHPGESARGKGLSAYEETPGGGPAGENLAWGSGPSPYDPVAPYSDLTADDSPVLAWYSEIANCVTEGGDQIDHCFLDKDGQESGIAKDEYESGNVLNPGMTGHYTSLMWYGVDSIGCGSKGYVNEDPTADQADQRLGWCRNKPKLDISTCSLPNLQGHYSNNIFPPKDIAVSDFSTGPGNFQHTKFTRSEQFQTCLAKAKQCPK